MAPMIGQARNGGSTMARAQFDFGGVSDARRGEAVADRGVELLRVAGAGGVVVRDRAREIVRVDADQLGKFGERRGLERRHLGAGGALPVGDRADAGVEDREGHAARHLEMQAPRERLPGLVDEARALVEEAAPVAVRPRCRRDRAARPPPGCSLRGSTGSMCMPSGSPEKSAPSACAMRMPSPELKCARGASSGTLSPPAPKCSRIIAALAWKPPQARIDGVGGQRLAGGEPHARDRAVARRSAHRPRSRRRKTTPASRAARRQLAVDGLAAADRLDARRALRQIIDRLVERHAVARRSIAPWRGPARRAWRNSPRRPGIASPPACRGRTTARRDRPRPSACRTASSGCCRRRRPRGPCR